MVEAPGYAINSNKIFIESQTKKTKVFGVENLMHIAVVKGNK